MDEKATSGVQMATDGGRCVTGFANETILRWLSRPPQQAALCARIASGTRVGWPLRCEWSMLCYVGGGRESRTDLRCGWSARFVGVKEWHKMRQFHSLCHWVGVRSHGLRIQKHTNTNGCL